MSQENVDAAQKGLDAFNRRDKAAWLALNDPEVEAVPPRDWPESDPIRGREAVWDKVVAHMRGEMHGKASGASVAFSYWTVGTFRSGKMLRTEWFANRVDALEAAGLRD